MKTDYFIHEAALCYSNQIGADTRIWAYTHILEKARVGMNCNICDHVFIENDVIIGDNVTIKSGVQLWDGVRLENNVFIGPNVAFTNDAFPRSKCYPEKFLPTRVGEGASIGANATLLPGIEIGEYAMVGAGSVVTASIPAHAIVVGNPAKIIGFNEVKQCEWPNSPKQLEVIDTHMQAVKGYLAPEYKDSRGGLTFFEFDKTIPFSSKRTFLIYDVSPHKFRGNHAHRQCHQFIVCVHGSVKVVTDDGTVRQTCLLKNANQGLHIGPKTWTTLYDFSKETVVSVFTSDYYDRADYINDYHELKRLNSEA